MKRIGQEAIKASNDAINLWKAFDKAAENMRKLGSDALKSFGTEMKKVGNINDVFVSTDEKCKQHGNDVVDAFDKLDNEIKDLCNDAVDEETKKFGDTVDKETKKFGDAVDKETKKFGNYSKYGSSWNN